MLERLHFLVAYVGSAAIAAFMAVCVTSPQIATFTCPSTGAGGLEHCELIATRDSKAPDATATDAATEQVASEPSNQDFAAAFGAN